MKNKILAIMISLILLIAYSVIAADSSEPPLTTPDVLDLLTDAGELNLEPALFRRTILLKSMI